VERSPKRSSDFVRFRCAFRNFVAARRGIRLSVCPRTCHSRAINGMAAICLHTECRQWLLSQTANWNYRWRIQPVNATVWLNISAGV